MSMVRRLLGLTDKTPKEMADEAKPQENVVLRPDQLSVDTAIASQQNNQAALRVRETLSQMLAKNDAIGSSKR